MKLIHLSSTHKRFDSRIFHKICVSASNAGHQVTLIVADGKGCETSNNVRIIDVGHSPNRLTRLLINPIKILLKTISYRNCIFHLHDPELLFISLFLRRKKTRVIYDMHENLHIQILSKEWIIGSYLLKKLIANFSILYQKFFIKKIDYLIVAQPVMKIFYSNMNKNIVDINNFAKPLEYIKNQKFINKKFNLVYAGGLSEDKGLINMINLIKYLPESYKLHIAGPIDYSQKELIEKLNHKKIIFYGLLSNKELNLLYQNCSIGLIMFNNVGQYSMSYSIKLFEYIQFGMTVIMPNFGDWVDFNKQYKVGINIDPKNTKECAKKIINLEENLLEDFFYSNKLLQNNKFNWEKEYIKLEKRYKSINKSI
tara:strand:+ start:744 stop:1847 length:1104 start_codon:yes stop_codon:yes gene_type:complete